MVTGNLHTLFYTPSDALQKGADLRGAEQKLQKYFRTQDQMDIVAQLSRQKSKIFIMN